MKKLFFVVVFILASCAPQATAVPTATATHTATVQATVTSALTATPTEPPTPVTYTPDQIKQMKNTEILAAAPEVESLEKFISPAGKHIVLYRNGEGKYTQAYNMLTKEMITDLIHISTDPENPTPITLEDVESGKLAMSEHLQCHGFPDTTPIDWRKVTEEGYFSRVLAWNQPEDYSDPAKRPQYFCSFSEITIDLGRGEMPYILIGVANLNKDKTIGFLHKPTRPEDVVKYLELEGDRFFGVTTEEIMNDAEYPEKRVVVGMTPDIEKWGQEWADTDILPVELEKCLVQLA